ncbi:MAG: ATP-grasp domain-containing protein [Polyangiaceae bacterium]
MLHQAVPKGAPPDELDVLSEVAHVRSALRELGHSPRVVAMTADLRATRAALRRSRPDCVFNLVETVLGHGVLSCAATALLESESWVYTGADTANLALTTDKIATKRLLHSACVATPPWLTLNEGTPFRPGTYVLKPRTEDASVGLDEDSLIRSRTATECRRRMAEWQHRCRRVCFAERFIEGREFNVSVLGTPVHPRVLPIAEIEFRGFRERGKPTLLGYRAKWDESSFEFKNSVRSFDSIGREPTLHRRLQDVAVQSFRTLGCTGYARVDIRVDRRGTPFVLEVNANPCIAPDSGLVAAATRAGLTFADVIAEILDCATSPR